MSYQAERLSDKTTVHDKYGCHNRKSIARTGPYLAQDGWQDGRKREVVVKAAWANIPCGHSDRRSDDRCGDCHWRYRE